jgi:hypothetical protein
MSHPFPEEIEEYGRQEGRIDGKNIGKCQWLESRVRHFCWSRKIEWKMDRDDDDHASHQYGAYIQDFGMCHTIYGHEKSEECEFGFTRRVGTNLSRTAIGKGPKGGNIALAIPHIRIPTVILLFFFCC